MDDADYAVTLGERELAKALQQRKPEGPAATGVCRYCGEPTAGRWCNVECRDQWEEESARPLASCT
jgi:hypothetical protein